ncbi:MAG: hypothetical protein MUC92_03900 [Fimbriimonadaceae bacterium]|jgi:hypothetical protein|nr:hypothetical protein [Fimbriimonadaceae bacterium]
MVHQNGKIWLDTSGKPIQAHGGGLLFHQGTFFWYGENKGAPNSAPLSHPNGWIIDRTDVIGISCYSSKNLVDWKDEGLVLAANPYDSDSPLHPSQVCERPKVVWDSLHQQFHLRWHRDDGFYLKAEQGVAVSASPTGSFHIQDCYRPYGEESRDLTVFDSGDGLVTVFSSRNNASLLFGNLTTGETKIVFENQYREAPALFSYQDRWWMISSGCTGWDPNPARLDSSPDLFGEWQEGENPCQGEGGDETWGCQSTFVLQIPGEERYIACFDRWNRYDLQHSGYAWLEFDLSCEKPTLHWKDTWDGI